MRVTRRNFLKMMAISGAGTVAFAGCGIPEHELTIQAPITPPEDLLQGFDAWYATASRQCDAGCGLIVRVMEGRAKKVEGNPDHPINTGKTCIRCQAAVQALYHPERVRGPMLRKGERGQGVFEPISWDQALQTLTERLRAAQTPGATVLITEPLNGHDGLITQRFGRNINAQVIALDPMDSTAERAAVMQVYGQRQLPDYDVANADIVVSLGADWLGTWGSHVRYERGYATFRRGKAGKRGMLYHAEPRFSITAASADKWLPLNPGSEGVLAYSIAQVISSRRISGGGNTVEGAINKGKALDAYRPEKVARSIGVEASLITEIAEALLKADHPLVIVGGSAGAYTNGLFNLMAGHTLNLLLDNINKPGGVRFNPDPVLGLPANEGVGSLNDWIRLADRLATGKNDRGQASEVKVVMVRGVNPAYSVPNALDFRTALAKAPYLVSFSSFIDETTQMADLILPDSHFLERWGSTVPAAGPGYPTLTLMQPVVKPLYDTRGSADVFLDLAKRLNVKTDLPWDNVKLAVQQGAEELFRLNSGSVTAPTLDAFWFAILQRGGWWDAKAVPAAVDMGALAGRLQPAPDPTEALPEWAGKEDDYPLLLTPFNHHALGAGEGANLPWLQAAPDPITTMSWRSWAEINPELAKKLDVKTGDLLNVQTPVVNSVVPVYVNPATPPETVAVPMGQGHWQYGRWAFNRGVNPLAMIAATVEPQTGSLAWNSTRAKVTKAGGHMTMPLYEGDLGGDAVAAELHEIVQITRLTGGEVKH
ncbi:MAG: molybdopterin-dependent oxidoreductase [Chloroflexi bacterium]|nr:molybdopterin-dependent oxidoreductase [Chloroflexota bacterium]